MKVTRDQKRLLLIGGILLLLSAETAGATNLLQVGAKGEQVREMQSYLHQLNYLKPNPTGYYGRMTAEAVKSFQLENGLKPDGKVGPATANLLRQAVASRNKTVTYIVKAGDSLETVAEEYRTSVAAIIARNNLPGKQITEGQRLIVPVGENRATVENSRNRQGVQLIPWSIVAQLWKTGTAARVIDVETGKSFMAQRYYGYYHADIEPLTKQDTRTLYEIYGNHWSWSRRAVIVQVKNLYIAGSINGMPHGGEAIFNNDFKGQICCHFLGSKIHQDGEVDPDHMAMIQRAANSSLAKFLPPEETQHNNVPAVAVPGTQPRGN